MWWFLSMFILLLLVYACLIWYYRKSWKAIPLFKPAASKAFIKISVLIPARNEEHRLGRLLQALKEQHYPPESFEVIVIDDHSTDQTVAVVKSFSGIRCIQLQDEGINSYKKKAIETGIAAATGDLIITTDADCLPGPLWLQTIADFKTAAGVVFIVAPVVFEEGSSLVEQFQEMDFMILQGITAASAYTGTHAMCNGANMAYERRVFYEVNGFNGIDGIASGDDLLLLHKIAKLYPQRIGYLMSKEALVSTPAMPGWKEFINQRIRWASKAKYYEDKKIQLVLVVVYLFNLSFLFMLLAGFFHNAYWWLLLAGWLLKTLAELSFFLALRDFFNKRWSAWLFFAFQPLHIAYTLLAGFLGSFGTYEWKGRKVK